MAVELVVHTQDASGMNFLSFVLALEEASGLHASAVQVEAVATTLELSAVDGFGLLRYGLFVLSQHTC